MAADTTVAPSPANNSVLPGVTDAPGLLPTTVDPCAIVTTDDVNSAFGGTVAPGVLDPGNTGLSALPGCDYAITGQTNTGDSGSLTQVSIGLTGDYISYDEMRVAYPETEKVEGIGKEAWYITGRVGGDIGHAMAGARQLHIDLGGSELMISGMFPGDEAAVKAEVVAFAQTVLGKL